HIVVVRFSAMGDVILIVPVLYSILKLNPKLNITFVSRPFFEPLFKFSKRLTFIGVDLDKKYSGPFGMKKLAKDLIDSNKFDAFIDLHDVLRTQILRTFLKMNGVKTIVFEKGRKEKKELVAGKFFKPLKHTTERYLDAFKTLNLKTDLLLEDNWLDLKLNNKLLDKLDLKKSDILVGIAPFAKHSSKEWNLTKIEKLIEKLNDHQDLKILLFGGDEKEIKQLKKLSKKDKNCIVPSGKISFKDELSLIGGLKVMLSMDSANMHLATICKTPVVSIWGPTHHYAGFGPLNNEQNIVEISKEKLPCRPCSIYGKIDGKKAKKCAEQSMEMITVSMVYEKILPFIKQ
ncbi:MAG: glycosyltransferase family 9 protein, partial [Bacteroidia bacterium]